MAGTVRSLRGARDPQPMRGAAERQYSLEVHGWESQDATGERLKFGLRSIRLVAATAAEAIASARALLDPDGKYPDGNWAVVAGGEIAPGEARDWAAWHKAAESGA